MKILVDMNLFPSWSDYLVSLTHDAVHWSAIGDPRAPDTEILDWARERNYIVLTNDLDFGAILAATGGNAPSVIQVRTQDLMPDTLGPVVERILTEHSALLTSGALLTVMEDRVRIRDLPLG